MMFHFKQFVVSTQSENDSLLVNTDVFRMSETMRRSSSHSVVIDTRTHILTQYSVTWCETRPKTDKCMLAGREMERREMRKMRTKSEAQTHEKKQAQEAGRVSRYNERQNT